MKSNKDLEKILVELEKQWHPTKNGKLILSELSRGSNKKVWWLLKHIDYNGIEWEFEWEATLKNRFKGEGCPFLVGKRVKLGFNDLATTNPELAKQWHPTKNVDLKPEDVTLGSNKKVWWLLEYTASEGQKWNFEWEAKIVQRSRRLGCPFLSGKAVYKGFNDLATTNPQVAEQWHPTRNGSLKPTDVSAGSNKKVWWLLKYIDEKGDEWPLEWEAVINSRKENGEDCPFLVGRKVCKGFNDLATINPKLALQWHPTKNGDLKPSEVSCYTAKKVWWFLNYVDEKGVEWPFEWEALISHRSKGIGCPFLSGKAVYKGFNDLATTNPELAKQWHPTLNGNLRPTDITGRSNKKIWWQTEFIKPWQATVNNRINFKKHTLTGPKKKKVSITEKALLFYVKKIFKNVESNIKCIRELKNKELDILILDSIPQSNVKVAIENDGYFAHINREAEDLDKNELCVKSDIILIRLREAGLPNLNSTSIDFVLESDNIEHIEGSILLILKYICNLYKIDFPGDLDINIERDRISIYELLELAYKNVSLETMRPEIAREWHPIKNGNLKPSQVSHASTMVVWWMVNYKDNNGKVWVFEWEAQVCYRTTGSGCPYILGQKLKRGFNDLETRSPELALQWHPTRNGKLKPSDVVSGSNKKVWWRIKYMDEYKREWIFEWEASINHRYNRDQSCPYITNKKVYVGFNDLATKRPDLAFQWHPTRNGELRPSDVTCGTLKKVWWTIEHYDTKGQRWIFEWEASVNNRVSNNNGCPFLAGRKVCIGFNDLATQNPKLAKEWHPTKNGQLKATDVTCSSGKKVWWLIQKVNKNGEKVLEERLSTVNDRNRQFEKSNIENQSY